MKAACLLIVAALPLAACSKQPQVDEKNASVAEVAQKVREAGADSFVEPGKWQTKVTLLDVSIPGAPPQVAQQMKQSMGRMQDSTIDICLTAENVKRPKEDFFAGKAKNCRYDHFTMSGGKIDAVMRCEEQGTAMTMTIDGTYSHDSYSTDVTMEIASGGEGSMKLHSRSDSHRVGQCTGDEINAKTGEG